MNNSKCSDGKRVFHAEGTILDISDGGYCRNHEFQGGIVFHVRSFITGRKQMGHRWLVVAAAASVNFMWWDSPDTRCHSVTSVAHLSIVARLLVP